MFVVQASLVSAARFDLHKRLGFAGAFLAGLVVVTSYAAAIEAARLNGDHGGLTAADRLYSDVLVVTTFGVLVALGIAFRKRREIHKRLMFVATLDPRAGNLTRRCPARRSRHTRFAYRGDVRPAARGAALRLANARATALGMAVRWPARDRFAMDEAPRWRERGMGTDRKLADPLRSKGHETSVGDTELRRDAGNQRRHERRGVE